MHFHPASGARKCKIHIFHKEKKVFVKESDLIKHRAHGRVPPRHRDQILSSANRIARDPAHSIPRPMQHRSGRCRLPVELILPSGITSLNRTSPPNVPRNCIGCISFFNEIRDQKLVSLLSVRINSPFASLIPAFVPPAKPGIGRELNNIDTGVVFFHERNTVICRSIVYKNHLVITVCLLSQRTKTILKEMSTIIIDNNNADKRFLRSCCHDNRRLTGGCSLLFRIRYGEKRMIVTFPYTFICFPASGAAAREVLP